MCFLWHKEVNNPVQLTEPGYIMIGWYVQSAISQSFVNSGFQLLDIKAPWTMCQVENDITGNIGFVSLNEARQFIVNKIGETQTAVLMGQLVKNSSSPNLDIEKLNLMLPSISVFLPKLYSVYESTHFFDKTSYIIFTELKKYLSYDRNRRCRVGTFDNNILSSPALEGLGVALNSIPSSSANFIVIKDISKTPDFANSTYYIIRVILDSSNDTYAVSIYEAEEQTVNFIRYLFSGTIPDFNIIKPPNPYGPGGESGEGGGGGSFDDDSDIIGIPSLPTLSSANTGFTRIYNPSLSQVQDLARYLWTDDSVIETIWNHIKQFFENPMDAIIGFNLVPVVVPNGGTENFKLMYIDTGVSMTVAANQFVDVDCGTLEIKPYYGSALDYSPYTKISCFLPFIGNVSLNVDEVMDRTLQVKYRVDICSGSCVAYILVDGNAIYQYSGHCAIPIPLASADFSSYVNAAISVAKLAGAALTAGAGALAGQPAENAAQQTNQVVSTTQQVTTARNPATGRQITTGTVTTTTTRDMPSKEQSSTEASFAGISAQNVSNTVGAIMSSKPHIEHSGSFSGNSGYLGVRRPFIIIERPNMCMPANYQALNGFPCMITLELGSCKGFTRVQQVQLTGLHATNPEQAEILQLLKSGVIL